MEDINWPRVVNKVITERWSQLKKTLVVKDFVDYLIQKRVVTLDYWIGLKSKPVSESERTEDFLAQVMKFDKKRYNYFLEALLTISRKDLVEDLVKAQEASLKQLSSRSQGSEGKSKPKSSKSAENNRRKDGMSSATKSTKTLNSLDQHQPLKRPPEKTDSPSKNPDNDSNIEGTAELMGDQLPEDLKKAKQHKPTCTETGNDDLRKQGGAPCETAASETRLLTPTSKTTADDVLITETREESNQDSTNTREEILKSWEEKIKSRQTELDEKEKQLKEHEESLKLKETELLIREHSMSVSDMSLHTFSGTNHRNDHMSPFDSLPPTASTTQSSEVLADVHEQLKAIRKARSQEIEDEHGSPVVTLIPSEAYVKIDEFQVVQKDIEDIKSDIANDRQQREALRQKVESLKQEIEALNFRIKQLELEKAKNKNDHENEIAKIRKDIKISQENHTAAVNGLMLEIRAKQGQCSQLERNMEEVIKDADELEKRVEILEEDQEKYKDNIAKYEKDISDLRQKLTFKESEVDDLKKVLEDTESEKDELIDELSHLKAELANLKSEKRKLEQEKKSLLSRCVKPPWTMASRGSSIPRK